MLETPKFTRSALKRGWESLSKTQDVKRKNGKIEYAATGKLPTKKADLKSNETVLIKRGGEERSAKGKKES